VGTVLDGGGETGGDAEIAALSGMGWIGMETSASSVVGIRNGRHERVKGTDSLRRSTVLELQIAAVWEVPYGEPAPSRKDAGF